MRWPLPTFISLAATVVACSEADVESGFVDAVPLIDLDAARATVTAKIFGGDVDPSTVVATIGSTSIVASDVASYLEHFPTLTVQAAVEDLIDIEATLLTGFDADPHDLHDARTRGRVIAWMRANLWESVEVATPDPAAVEALLADPEQRVVFGVPELASATHVLLLAEGEEAQTPERAEHAEEMARRVRAELATVDRPIYGFDLIRAARATVPEGDPILAGEELIGDPGMLFPESYAGPPRWVGSPAVVPEFAEAAFNAPLNEVVGPVRSDFGWHLILVEERIPAEMPTADEQRAIAEARVSQHQRGRFFQETVHRLIRASQVVMFEENIALMSMSAEERIQMEATQRGAQFN